MKRPTRPTPVRSKRPAAAASAKRQPARAPKRAAPRRRKIRPWWYGFLMAVGLMTVLAAGAVGTFLAIIYTMSPDDPMEYYTPQEVTRVVDRSGKELIGEFRDPNGEQRMLVHIEDIPERLQHAFLAIEDARFYQHFGVDIIGIMRSAYRIFSGRAFEGASTITMQLPRNMEMIGRERKGSAGMMRKVREAMLAIWIERHYTKKQILEFYLNQINLGGNVCGVRLAAEKYFSKPLDQLTIAECATLAAIPKSPDFYNPIIHPDNNTERRNIVLSRMRDVGFITQEEFDKAKDEPLVIRKGKAQTSSGSQYPYFVDGLESDLKKYYRDELIQLDNDLNAKKKNAARSNDPAGHALQTAGLRITSTIDPAIQRICEKSVHDGLPQLEKVWQSKKESRQSYELRQYQRKHPGWDGRIKAGDIWLMRIAKKDVNKAGKGELTVTFKDYTGTVPIPDVPPFYDPAAAIQEDKLIDVRVKEMGEGNHFKGEFADARPMQGSMVVLDVHTGEVLAMVGGSGFASQQSGWVNEAMINTPQLGSSFKPFVYAAAFEKGYSPNDIVIDEPIAFDNGNQKPYAPHNYEPQYFGPTTLIEALEHSRNVSTIRLFEALRISKALEIVRKFDFAYGYNQPQWRIPPGISSCLGTVTCSPFVLASAYQVFANNGIGIRPKFIRSISDSQGRIPFPVRKPDFDDFHEVIKPLSACQMQYLMRQVVIGGTGAEVGKEFASPPYPLICGKTGTTNDDMAAWFTAYTPDLVIVSQIGFDPPRSMAPGMTGGTTAGHYIWIPAFREIIKTRSSWKINFDSPDEPMEFADICAATGKRAGPNCSDRDHKIYHNVPFARGKVPKAVCDGDIIVPMIAPMSGGSFGAYASLSPVHGTAHGWSGAPEPDTGDN